MSIKGLNREAPDINRGLGRALARAVEDVTGRPGPGDPGRVPDWADDSDVSLAVDLISRLLSVDTTQHRGTLHDARQIWGPGLSFSHEAEVFAGTALTVTDWAAENITIASGRAWVRTWRRPAVAARWAACLVPELVATGSRGPRNAERAVSGLAAFAEAPPDRLDTFARACNGLATAARETRLREGRNPAWREERLETAAQMWHERREDALYRTMPDREEAP